MARRVLQRLTGAYSLGQRQSWYQWELFDVAKVVKAVPNSLLAFAPNELSYHAVKLDIPEDSMVKERTVLRGFIRSGSEQQNFVVRHRRSLLRRTVHKVARALGRH